MNAKDFYRALDEKIPSLILLDIMLPDEDGFSILKTLKSFYANYTIPIIMVSAKGNEIDKVNKSLSDYAKERIKEVNPASELHETEKIGIVKYTVYILSSGVRVTIK